YRVFGRIQENLPRTDDQRAEVIRRLGGLAGWGGFGWAVAGGETRASGSANSLVVAGIHRVKQALEQIAMGKLNGVDHLEALACDGGCVGGPLTLEHYLVAEQRLRRRVADWQRSDRQKLTIQTYDRSDVGLDSFRPIEPRSILLLDNDILRALQKVTLMEQILDQLPGLDCGSCGSPGCKALAEDIAQGRAVETDCIFKLREKVRDLAGEMFDLARKLPPSLEK
ncbi:MAG: ferredoxin, partial [Negativicutes bacterium]|nr:ferredoxin [Negativicutes bacterium]